MLTLNFGFNPSKKSHTSTTNLNIKSTEFQIQGDVDPDEDTFSDDGLGKSHYQGLQQNINHQTQGLIDVQNQSFNQVNQTNQKPVLQHQRSYLNKKEETPLNEEKAKPIRNNQNEINAHLQKDFKGYLNSSLKKDQGTTLQKENYPQCSQFQQGNQQVSQSQTSLNNKNTKSKKNFEVAYTELAHQLYQEHQSDSNPQQKKAPANILINQENLQEMEKKRQETLSSQQSLFHRLNKEADTQKQYKVQLAQTVDQEKMKECTFAPKVFNDQQDERRTFGQFLQDQNRFQKQSQDKKIMLKYQMEKEEQDLMTGRPQTNKQINDVLLSQREQMPVHERLYQINKKKQEQQQQQQIQQSREMKGNCKTEENNPNNTFRPTICEKSKNLSRNGKVGEVLYQDALRRKEKQEQLITETSKQQKQSVFVKFTSTKSEQLVAQKFIKEFEIVLSEVITSEEEPCIDYIKMSEIFRRLCFIHNDNDFDNPAIGQERSLLYDIWTILKGEEYGGITRRNLCQFCLVLIGITSFNLSCEQEPPARKNALMQAQDQMSSDAANALAKDEDFTADGNNNYFRNNSGAVNSVQQPVSEGGFQSKTAYQMNDEFYNKLKDMKSEMQSTRKINIGNYDQNCNWIVNFDDSKQVQKMFDTLYRNRLASEELKKTSYKETNSFHPTINDASKSLANQYREKLLEETAALIENKEINVKVPESGKITHADLLLYQKKAQLVQHEKRSKQIESDQLKNCTFKPQTNNYEQKSVQQNQQIDNNNQEQEQAIAGQGEDELDKKSEQNKTVHPTGIKKSIQLYNLAKPRSQKVDKSTIDLEYERNCDECTFQPDLVTKNQKSVYNNEATDSSQVFAKNIDKTIERMKKGRQQREQNILMLQRGYTNGNVSNQKMAQAPQTKPNKKQKDQQVREQKLNNVQPSNYEQAQQQEQPQPVDQDVNQYENQPNLYQDEPQLQPEVEDTKQMEYQSINSNAVVPLLFVDVNLGPGKTERIIVYEGDTSDKLAEKFAQEHGLEEFMKLKLKELLDNQISGLLTRIEEEELPSANSDNE